eukprot:scaffold164705_cov57-Cyclotella_meneghiniana.AAC.1
MEPALNPVKSLVILYGEISGGTRGRSPLLAKFQRPKPTGLPASRPHVSARADIIILIILGVKTTSASWSPQRAA